MLVFRGDVFDLAFRSSYTDVHGGRTGRRPPVCHCYASGLGHEVVSRSIEVSSMLFLNPDDWTL